MSKDNRVPTKKSRTELRKQLAHDLAAVLANPEGILYNPLT